MAQCIQPYSSKVTTKLKETTNQKVKIKKQNNVYIRAACVKTIAGHGIKGYIEAIEFLVSNYGE